MKIVCIDYSNLKFGTKMSGWDLDMKSFRSWLRDKYKADKVVIFLGFYEGNKNFYEYLENLGYELYFKPIVKSRDGKIKGNVDGELILYGCCAHFEMQIKSFVLVSGDGDYNCLVEFLKKKSVSVEIISPNKQYLSYLLKKTNARVLILEDFKEKLKTKEPSDMP